MTTTDLDQQTARDRRRAIGVVGIAARAAVGFALLGDVLYAHLSGGFSPGPWVLGLVGLPGVLLAGQWLRARGNRGRFQATGPVGHVLNLAVFLALWLTPWYAPALSITSDAAIIFYGTSMLLAAVRGYAGCEVLAVTNWLLRRDDQVGCVLFQPVDHVEGRRRGWPVPTLVSVPMIAAIVAVVVVT